MMKLFIFTFLTVSSSFCPCFCVLKGDQNDIQTSRLSVNNISKVVLRFYPKNDQQVNLLALQLPKITHQRADFWTQPNYFLHSVDVMVPSDLLPVVKNFSHSNGLSDMKIVVKDVQKLIQASMARSNNRQTRASIKKPLKSFFRSFHRLSGINSFMDQLAKRYPYLVTTESIGKTFEGRDMRIVKISSNLPRESNDSLNEIEHSNTRQIIWIDAAIHAREWIAPPSALYLAYMLASRYGSDAKITSVLDSFDFVILPAANPDGYEYSHTNDRLWRRTRSTGHSNGCIGVDANRNFDFHWGEVGVSTSNESCSDQFVGPHAFSEPETRAISSYLTKNKDRVRVYISLHAQAQMWLYPWGYTRQKSKRDDQLRAKAEVAVSAVRQTYGKSFNFGASASVIYPTSGCSQDWAFGSLGIPYSYSVELRHHPFCHLIEECNKFDPPTSEIIPCGIEVSTGIISLAKNLIVTGDDVTS